MMGRQDRDQRQLFYEFSLDEMILTDHLLRRINAFATAVPQLSSLRVRREAPLWQASPAFGRDTVSTTLR
jgi:hypothetical protein